MVIDTEYPSLHELAARTLLAGINLAVAMPLILWAESMDAAFMRDREHYAPKAAAVDGPTAVSEEGSNAQAEGVSIDPCQMIVDFSTQERVLIGANFPALALTEWRSLCPAHWTLAGMLHAGGWAPHPHRWLPRGKSMQVCFC
jgi:hypothetical protein